MRIRGFQVLLAVMALIAATFCVALEAQTTSQSESYKAQRTKAINLFNQDRHLEALPLFEDLAKENPSDADVLLGLATCLVSHSATLENDKDATKERLRARGLLLKAKELGNTSTLLENLLQTIPVDGVIKYSKNPSDQAMRLAEAAFARQDFDEAIKNYSKVLELDPKSYSATLFIGDTYFTKKDFAKAGEWYGRAIQLDPNRETAYRYYADMLLKNGDAAKSRTLFIQSVVAEPYNPITWRGLEYWAKANHTQLLSVHITPRAEVTQKDPKNITLTLDDKQSGDAAAAWAAYGIARASWRGERFKKEFPKEKNYRHSLAEEVDAMNLAVGAFSNANDGKKLSSPPKDPDLATLLRLSQAGMIEAYVLLNAADEGIAQDYNAFREKNRGKLEAYLSEFVVPQPGPSK